MSKIFLVTVCSERRNNDTGEMVKLYNDEAEMIIDDGTKDENDPTSNTNRYMEYLRQKYTSSDPTLSIVRYPLNIKSTIDIESMLVEDAKSKLSPSELDALKNEILNS